SFIGQAGNPQELLLLNQCYELEIKYVIRIESVTWVRKSFDLSREISGLFCRYHWDPTNGSIVDLPDENTIINHSPLLKTTLETCPICLSHTPDFKWLTDKATGLISLGTTDQYESLGFTLHGKETYRLKDFVRVSGQTPKDPQQIGQIVEISDIRPNPDCYRTVSLDDGPFQPSLKLPLKLARTKWPKITIRLYRRSPWPGSSVDHSPLFKDDRRLWITEEESLVDARKQLEGKCEIVHLVKKDGVMVTLNSHRKVYWESIIDRENCFYTILPDETQRRLCSVPMINKGWESELSSREPDWIKIKAEGQGESYSDLVKNYGKGRLRHLELFCGIGSMSVAFMELGLTAQQSTMFIDLEVSACQTIAVNFPRSRVICGDVNEVLELMIRGKEDDHLIDRRTGDKIFKKDLPRPGDFDLITAGFPCGSHSSLNVLRKANDSKNALCASALSFVVYLKPDYVFFENVRGLLRTKFQDSSDESAVSKAFLRLIPGTLMDAGYQVKFGVLQAAQFGSPQERRRVIFSGTRKGLTSPTLPEPTHHFPDDFLPIFLPSNTPDGKNSVKTDYRSSRSGALPAVTVGDTLSDLPPFEYINPMKIIPRVDAKSQEEIKSRKRLIPALDRVITNHEAQLNAIGYELFEYSSVPRNNYQNWLRKDMVCKQQDRFRDRENETGTDSVETIANWHITPRWSGKAVERMWHIPFVEGADHYCEQNANKISDFDGNFGRLSLDKQFKTIITTMDPKNQGACGRVLHPLQHRVLSVLEAQRAQGFPDWYRLDPGLLDPKVNFTKTLYKLVGNAIPIPICVQLGKSLMRARELDWIESGRPIEDGTIAQQVLDLIDLLRESVDV
ncbi:S-adenosyl-L-methionine-dependent methyltransferase, partial [Phakopsora pachyrhizi]